jgi:shikimate dehydrogenase
VRLPLDASTRVFALLGDPVAHSLSPRFQNAALAALGLDGVYTALRCSAGDLPGLLAGLARAGGGGNVTVPHKALAARSVDRATDAVGRTGACNTFWAEDGLVHGDNTDVEGVRGALRALLGRPPAGATVLLLGAGGAAAAVLCALADDGAGRVVLANRTAERAQALAARFAGTLRIEVADRVPRDRFDLAVNATSLGLHPGDPLPPLPPADAALDLVYAPGETPWVREMRARGVPAADGREMLLRQGAAAFRRWWGIDAPLDAMRAALADPPS